MVNYVLMIKGDEEKPVHPGNVANHERAGWKLKPAEAEPILEPAPVIVPAASAESAPLIEPPAGKKPTGKKTAGKK